MFPERVAVVGCGGFIGSHLVERLLHLGVCVEGWDLDLHRLEAFSAHSALLLHQADYSSAETLHAIASHQVVIHLAALCNPSLYNTEDERVIHSNYTLPARLADACAQSGAHLIYFSTCEVYGRTVRGCATSLGAELRGDFTALDLLHEDSSPLLLGPVGARRWSYACAKQLMERTLVALGAGRHLAWTVVRPFNFLGPSMDFIPGIDGEGIPRVMACFMDALLHRRPLLLVDGGYRQRAFTWIGDAVDAVLAILEHLPQAQGQAFNIGNPINEITIRNLAALMVQYYSELTGQPPLAEPWRDVGAHDFYGEGYEDSDRRLPDISKAKSLLGWSPQVGLRETIHATMRWYVEHYRVRV